MSNTQPFVRHALVALTMLAASTPSASLRAQTRNTVPAALPTAAGGDRARDFSIALQASTLGVGLEVAKLVGSHAAIRVGAQGGSYHRTSAEEGTATDDKVKMRSVAALIDLFPARRGAFRLSGGVVGGTASFVTSETGEFSATNEDGSTGPARLGARVESVKYPTSRPYAGIGWGTPASRRGGLGFVVDIGVLFGRPEYTSQLTGPAAADPALQAELAQDRQDTEGQLAALSFYPKIGFGLSYRF
jgi:hypothetical protein